MVDKKRTVERINAEETRKLMKNGGFERFKNRIYKAIKDAALDGFSSVVYDLGCESDHIDTTLVEKIKKILIADGYDVPELEPYMLVINWQCDDEIEK